MNGGVHNDPPIPLGSRYGVFRSESPRKGSALLSTLSLPGSRECVTDPSAMYPTLDNLEYFLPQLIGHLDSPHRLL